MINSVITGSGSYIPEKVFPNSDFINNKFFSDYGKPILNKTNLEIIKQFEEITGIRERRYVTSDLVASDIGTYAAKEALKGFDKESFDYIIFAHNFGDIKENNRKTDQVPSLAGRVKYNLGIENPKTIASDLPFGCPGWLHGMIMANYFIKGGLKRILVIGGETLSRVSDPHDRDSMLYSDGAGAVVIEAVESEEPIGIISHAGRSDTIKHLNLLRMGKSYNPNYKGDELFLKMKGHKLYVYALQNVPGVVKESLEKSGLGLGDIRKVLLHQANEKMDNAILERVYEGLDIPEHIMPMTISHLGNSSVATLPTLYDLLVKGELNDHKLDSGDNIIFASVGAGMNINSVVYRMP